MSSRHTEFIDPWRVAERRQSFAGECAIAELGRLAPLLLNKQGIASFEFDFSRDESRRPLILGYVVATLPLQCQRCLEKLDLKVDSTFRLVVVQGPDEAEGLDEDFDPLFSDEAGISLLQLVEDELLLSLPAIPRHSDCKLYADDETGQREEPKSNPFAVLETLKKTD